MMYRHRKSHLKAWACLLLLAMLISLFPLTAAASENAESRDYRTWLRTVYSKDNGLPCGTANDLATTSDGLIWIGTYAGLYRANGTSFQLMNEYDSVKNVNALYVDDLDRLCVGTNDSGLSIFYHEKLLGTIDKNGGLPSDAVRSIVKASDGIYYIGTADSLVMLSFNGTFEIVKIINEIKYASKLTADSAGHVAAITSHGILYLLQDGDILCQTSLSDEESFSVCAFDEDGTLYAGSTAGRILQYEVKGDALKRITKIECPGAGELKALYRVDQDTLFVCSDNGIGYIGKDNAYRSIDNTEFNNSVDSMTMDYQGNLWFSSSRLGVMRLCDTDFSDLFAEFAVSSAVVNSVEKHRGLLYVGTDTGLVVLDETAGKAVENAMTEALAGIRIRQIFRDQNDILWFCTYGKGLISYDGTEMYAYDGEADGLGLRVRTMMQMKDGTIVASGDNGVALIRNGKVQKLYTEKDGLPNAKPLCLLEDGNGNILAGTDGNGIACIAENGDITLIGKEKGLPSEVVLRMVRDTAGSGIFIVTSNALGYLDADGSIHTFNRFPYSNNFDLIEQDGNLLIPGSAGIYMLTRDALMSNDDDMAYTLLDSKVGLLHSLTANSWLHHDKENGILYLATNSGVTSLDLNSSRGEQKTYKVKLAQITVDGEKLDIENMSSFSFPSSIKKLEIKPELINFSISNPIISCYLEGFDSAPIIMEQSELSTLVYTNLPAGKYRFHIAVVDAGTGLTIEERVYSMEKSQAFYENIWFILLLAFSMTALSLLIGGRIARAGYRKKLEEQQRELELSKRQVEMSNATIVTIAKTVDAKDNYTSRHSVRVAEYSVKIAEALGYDKASCDAIQKIALLHDIGKIGIPDQILNKPGNLTDEEYRIMRSHVVHGADILKDFTLVDHVDDGVRYHHERYDGSGYPNGLRGDEIPLTARIIGVADAFDAMTSNRIYRNALNIDDVLDEIRSCKGTQFDPDIADILIALVESGDIDPVESYRNTHK